MPTTTVPKLTITKRKNHWGYVSYELTHKGRWHYCVSVYAQVDWNTGNFTGYKVNWSCWGDTTVEETKEFVKALNKGIKLAEDGTKRGGK